MASEVERFIRVQNLQVTQSFGRREATSWHTIPSGERVRVLEYSSLSVPNEDTGMDEKRHIFHIRYIDGIGKGSRVTYFGNRFTVREVSESGRLVGLELSCAAEVD